MSFPITRRDFLRRSGMGLAALGLADLQAAKPHFAPKAKRVIHFFLNGGPSHVDTFDYKPELVKRHGMPLPGAADLITFQGAQGNLVKPIWEFKPRGQSGKMISDLLPNIAGLADDMCFIHSMTAKSNTHGPAENQMSTGYILDGFPGMGSWVTYALGSECDDMPAFVAIPDPRGVPQIGPRHWNSAFLPAAFQGTAFNASKPIPNLIRPASVSEAADRDTRAFVNLLNQRQDDHCRTNKISGHHRRLQLDYFKYRKPSKHDH